MGWRAAWVVVEELLVEVKMLLVEVAGLIG